MTRITWSLTVLLVASAALSAWLYRENRSLEERLAAASRTPAPVDPEPAVTPAAPEPAAAPADTGSGARGWLFGRRARPRPEITEEARKETRGERRQRRQAEIAAMFGRLDGETAEEYRARMVPFVQMALAGPRQRMTDARREAEDEAGVTERQRAELDAVFEDAYSEILELTNSALETGELTPYARNWSGVLNFAGGVGAVLGTTEGRISEVLRPEQMDVMYDRGFEWGEYLGVSVPWEQLDPPPPPDS